MDFTGPWELPPRTPHDSSFSSHLRYGTGDSEGNPSRLAKDLGQRVGGLTLSTHKFKDERAPKAFRRHGYGLVGRHNTQTSHKLSQKQLLDEQRRLEWEHSKTVSDNRRQHGPPVFGPRPTGKLHSEATQVQNLTLQLLETRVEAEATRLADFHDHIRRLDAKVPEKLKESPARGPVRSQIRDRRSWDSQQLTSGQIDSLVQKLYSLPKTQPFAKRRTGSAVEEIVEKMLAEEELTHREVSHEEVDDYLLRLKVTHTPRYDTDYSFKRGNIQLRSKELQTYKSPVHLRSPLAWSVQSTRSDSLRLSEEASSPYNLIKRDSRY